MVKPLEGKVGLVTGGSNGIGRAIVKRLSDDGATAINADISAPKDHRSNFVKCDIRIEKNVRKTFNEIEREFGKLDFLINNAGINRPVSFLEMTVKQWDEVIDTNLKGTFLCSREAVRIMEKQTGSGSIIMMTSESGMSTVSCPPINAHYATTKMGLIGLTRILAVNFAPKIRVNAIAPGWIDTEIHNNPYELAKKEKVLADIPLKRFGRPSEVAALVSFLVSGESEYITGQTILIGGGRVLG